MFQNGTLSVLISLLFVPFVAEAAFRGKGVEYGSDVSSSYGVQEVGVLLGSTTAVQEHLNTVIRRANWRMGGISNEEMLRAWEIGVQYGYRPLGSSIEWLLRPSYFYQKSAGSGSAGSFNYAVTSFMVFPMARFIPLENNFMKFYTQFGIGYGRAYGKVEEADASVEMQGDTYGTQLGVGLELCYEASHCFGFETNYRVMKVARSLSTGISGTFGSGSLSQTATHSEVEFDGSDLVTQLGGLQLVLGYSAHF